MQHAITEQLTSLKAQNAKGFAILIDPDKVEIDQLVPLVAQAEHCGALFFFVGGSLLTNDHINELVPALKAMTDIPVVLFPGSVQQIVPSADAILFLSLISGRNPDLLIGNHVLAAPLLRKTQLEVIPTGYILVDSGKATTVNYISQTLPIPHDKPDIALCTALAGEYLGMRLIYMDGGSGAAKTISPEMVEAVSQAVKLPLIVGGGIRSANEATTLWEAGADLIVIGNAFEKDPDSTLMEEIAMAKARLVREMSE